MKILLAEDDPISRRILEKTTKGLGHDCLVAEDGLEAWETYQKTPDVEVVISDWMMPNMDGVEFCRKVRGLRREGYTFFIILTALEGKARLLEGLRAGADEYLVKPLDREQLQARLAVASRVTALRQHVSGESKSEVGAEAGRDDLPVRKSQATKHLRDKKKSEDESDRIWGILVSQGKVSEEQLYRALEVQRSDPREIGEILFSLGIISRADLGRAQAQRLGLSYVDLDVRDIDPKVFDLVPERVLRRYGLVPVRLENGVLFVAMSDPTYVHALDDLSETSGYAVVPIIASEEDIEHTQTQLFGVEVDHRDKGT